MGFPGKFQITHRVYCSREWWHDPTGSHTEVSIQAVLGCRLLKAPGFHHPESSRPLVTMLKSCYLPRTVRKIHGNITFQLAGKRITPQSREILFSLIPLEQKGGEGVWCLQPSCLWGILIYWGLPIRCSLKTVTLEELLRQNDCTLLTFTTSSSSLLAACCFSSLVLNWEQI